MRSIKYYEGWHDIKRNCPYIGWGHRILPHEKFSKNLTYQQAGSCRKLCIGTMHFRLATNPFCNTFGLFCSSILQPALLWETFSPLFVSRRCCLAFIGDIIFPLSLQEGYSACARRLVPHFWDAYTPLFVPTGCVGLFVPVRARQP